MVIGENSVKKRKVIYDEYTHGFYAESKVESLQRQCDYRARLTDVINKAEDAKCKVACKQVDAEKQIFLMKNEKALHRHNEALLDHKAHKNVLERLAKERAEKVFSESELFGKYPPESLRPNLQEHIDLELKEMTPSVKRRREAARLLVKRNVYTEPKRAMSTEDLFHELKTMKSRVSSPVKALLVPCKTPDPNKPMPKLILPAITVKMGTAQERRHAESMEAAPSITPTKMRATKDMSPFPSVFITDPKATHMK